MKHYSIIVNRPGVAGAVLQTLLSLINKLTNRFPPNLVVFTTRLLRLSRCHLCHLRGVYLHVQLPSRVTCHVQCVMCQVSFTQSCNSAKFWQFSAEFRYFDV